MPQSVILRNSAFYYTVNVCVLYNTHNKRTNTEHVLADTFCMIFGLHISISGDLSLLLEVQTLRKCLMSFQIAG